MDLYTDISSDDKEKYRIYEEVKRIFEYNYNYLRPEQIKEYEDTLSGLYKELEYRKATELDKLIWYWEKINQIKDVDKRRKYFQASNTELWIKNDNYVGKNSNGAS